MTTETTEVSPRAGGTSIIETATKKDLVEHALTIGAIKTKTEGTKMLLSVLREKVRLFIAEASARADDIERRVAEREAREAAEAAEAGYGDGIIHTRDGGPEYPEREARRFSSHARNRGEERAAQMRRRKRNQRKHRRTLSRLRSNGAVRG